MAGIVKKVVVSAVLAFAAFVLSACSEAAPGNASSNFGGGSNKTIDPPNWTIGTWRDSDWDYFWRFSNNDIYTSSEFRGKDVRFYFRKAEKIVEDKSKKGVYIVSYLNGNEKYRFKFEERDNINRLTFWMSNDYSGTGFEIGPITLNRRREVPDTGGCKCPYHTASDGSRCGERSAFSRPGGDTPTCWIYD